MALTETRRTLKVGGYPIPDKQIERGVYNGVTVYKGGMISGASNGRLVPAGNANATTQVLGVLLEVSAVNETVTGNAAGTETARLTQGTFWFDNSAGADEIAEANLYEVCYAVDDETVSLSDGNGTRLPAGIIMNVDSALGVAVSIVPNIPLGASAGMVQKVGATIGASGSGEDHELTAAGTTQAFNIGSALPATAIVLSVRSKLDAVFANGSGVSLVMDLGHDGDTDGYESDFDVFTGSAHAAGEWQYESSGVGKGAPPALATAGTRQMVASFTQGADQLANTTGGPVHVEFLYIDVASVL